MNAETLSDILNNLMQGPPAMLDTELARCTGVAVNTIRRMASGQSNSPRRASLEPIADFFDITVAQLTGDEPIDPIGATLNEMERNALNRLRDIWQEKAESLGINAEKAALAMGYKSQKVVHRYLSGKIALNIDVVFKFAHLLHVESNEILEEMPKLDNLGLSWWDGKERRQRGSDSEKKESKWDGVDRRNPNRPARTLVPMLDWEEVGFLKDVLPGRIPGDGSKWVPTPVNVGPKAFALTVKGNSMVSGEGVSFPESSVIVVDPEYSSKNGSFVVASFSAAEQPVFRQLLIEEDATYLAPLNQAYMYEDVSEGFELLGVVRAMFQSVE